MGSHVHYESGSISEIVYDRHVFTVGLYSQCRMAYRIALFPMTLNDVEGRPHVATLFK